MSQQLQELIKQIKIEGVQAAQHEAQRMEMQAKQKAQQIIEEANQKAAGIIAQAKNEAARLHESTVKTLQQAARDMILNLRKEMTALLNGIIAEQVKESLNAEQLAKIIESVIKAFLAAKSGEFRIDVAVSASDLNALQGGFVKKLQEQIKQPLKFHSADDIGKGFTISFDGGKSSFDFTDESLVEYLSGAVNLEVAEIMRKSVKG